MTILGMFLNVISNVEEAGIQVGLFPRPCAVRVRFTFPVIRSLAPTMYLECKIRGSSK